MLLNDVNYFTNILGLVDLSSSSQDEVVSAGVGESSHTPSGFSGTEATGKGCTTQLH